MIIIIMMGEQHRLTDSGKTITQVLLTTFVVFTVEMVYATGKPVIYLGVNMLGGIHNVTMLS